MRNMNIWILNAPHIIIIIISYNHTCQLWINRLDRIWDNTTLKVVSCFVFRVLQTILKCAEWDIIKWPTDPWRWILFWKKNIPIEFCLNFLFKKEKKRIEKPLNYAYKFKFGINIWKHTWSVYLLLCIYVFILCIVCWLLRMHSLWIL